ncbi:amino acid adenylation domain-containing protein [Micromonospora sp. NBC_01655]|uniref:non-ribosomal peptide synthetase n=1 Tax=Micromonospora sp. NBC_01655 TaxID=2975983 RepID=UPI00224EFF4F|nr:amino acid adenylation domain-containing protein [Micromonospora sp. NBC_01655]MCX4472652.1 amino acid adenylation domain-containing protein [Micromonospora sp. NBC_01655]
MQGSGEYTFPASSAQEWIWLASQVDTEAAAYNLRGYARLPARVDAGIVHAALAELVRRHEPLRTALRLRDGALTQVVHAEVPVELAHLDVADLPPQERARRLAETEAADLAEPFPLDRAPLWRARLIRLPEHSGLLLVAHHSIFDGNSVPVFDTELRELCQAALEGRPARLPELEIQYADYAAWQSEQLRTGAGDADLAYWRDRLAGAPLVHAVPTDHPRTAGPGRPGAEIVFAVPEELRTALGGLGRQHAASPAMVLLAGYAALLHRLSGDPAVLVGLPVAGRDRPELVPIIGMFVNTLVLRIDVSGDPSFGRLVERVRDTMLAAWEHQGLPLPRLVEALSPPRTPGVQPLYQLGFNYLGKVDLDTSNGTAHEELLLEVNETRGRLEYRSDLFDAGTAERLVRRYLCLLRGALAGPDTALSALPLLDETERLLLAGWSTAGPAARPDGGPTVVDLVRAQAVRCPAAVALRDGAISLSYAELDRRAARLAARLRRAGVGPEHLVGVALPRSADVVVAMLAVLRSGAAYVPLDPAYPPQRLAYLVADSAASVVVTATGLRETLPPGPYTTICVDDPDADAADQRPDDAGTVAPAPGDLAYVIHTSGSTGRPKGAMIEHRSLAAHATWFVQRLGITPADRLLVLASPSFDVFGQEVFPALVAGATLVIAPPDGALDAPALLDAVRREQVTLLSCVPTVLQHLVAEPGLAACRHLRQVTCIGEQLTGDLAADLAAVLPVPLHNLYGPTETTIAVSAHTVPPGDRVTGPVPIGVPMDGAALHVLDERGEPTPVGVPGHLHIAGVPLGRGYLRRPAETAAAFVPDRFGPPGSRLYRTGDRCRWRTDGTLEFLERLDRQVKVNGARVELGEIETALRAQPGVREAAVVVRTDPRGGQRLVGYVVGDVEPDALRPALRATLPGHLVPTVLIGLPALPMMPSGKLDAAALPAPADQASAQAAPTPPRTGAEEMVAAVWAEVLGTGSGDVHANFFDQGGHSLLAGRVTARLADALDLDLPIHVLFAHPTVAGLAAEVERRLVARLDQLTDDEAAELLTARER